MISDGTNVFWFILGHGVFSLSSGATPVVNIWLHMGMHARYEVIVCKNLEFAFTDQRYIIAVSIQSIIKQNQVRKWKFYSKSIKYQFIHERNLFKQN